MPPRPRKVFTITAAEFTTWVLIALTTGVALGLAVCLLLKGSP